MLLCAEYILPITSEPILDGAVLVRDGKIADVGSAEMLRLRYPGEEERDFGGAAIIPGLIDLRTHMEYSVMRGIVEDQPYSSWAAALNALGDKMDAHDWHASCVLGGLDALQSGVTTVADVSSTGASCAAFQRLGLRAVVYREVGVMDKRRVDFAIDAARNDIARWSESVDADRITIGIAPSTPYVCHPLVFTRAAAVAREEGIPLAVSVAGSQEEYNFIRYGSSAITIANAQHKRGFVEIPPWLPTGVSPMRYVVNWGGFEADNVMAAQCVHVDDDDIRKLKEYDVSVACCPRYNAQLSMGVAPLTSFMRAGLRVGLGTGYSVAIDSTDMIAEMRIGLLIQRAVNPGRFLEAETMLRLGTIEAARALKMEDRIGSIEVGKCADLAVVDLSSTHQVPGENPYPTVVNSCTGSDVLLTMVDGDVKYEKDEWHVDVELVKDIARVIEIRGKLRD